MSEVDISKMSKLIQKYNAIFLGRAMQEAVDYIITDPDFLKLNAEEKAIFAVMLCAKAR